MTNQNEYEYKRDCVCLDLFGCTFSQIDEFACGLDDPSEMKAEVTIIMDGQQAVIQEAMMWLRNEEE